MHSTTLRMIAILGLYSHLPLAMGASSTSAVGMTSTNSTSGSPLPKDSLTGTKTDGNDDYPQDDTKETSATPVSSGAGGAPPQMVAGDMSSGKCMCPSPLPPTGNDKDGKRSPPTDDGNTNSTQTPRTTIPSMTPPPPTTGDKNSTSSAATMSEHAIFFTGLVSVAVASLVV